MNKNIRFHRKVFSYLKQHIFLVGIVAIIPVWVFYISPFLLRIPDDFSYKADIVSVDDFYDEKLGDFSGEKYSKTNFSYEVVSHEGPILTIKNIFNVEAPNGKTIFHREPLYGINSIT